MFIDVIILLFACLDANVHLCDFFYNINLYI